MIRLWNTLPNIIRMKDNYHSFLEDMYKKYQIHIYKYINLFHYDTEIDNIYLKLRFQCSNLRAEQFTFNMTSDSKCLQCNKNRQETLHHYFMDCAKYNIQISQLKNNITLLHPTFDKISNKKLLQIIKGERDKNIDHKIYKNIYQFIKYFIVTTGRFC